MLILQVIPIFLITCSHRHVTGAEAKGYYRYTIVFSVFELFVCFVVQAEKAKQRDMTDAILRAMMLNLPVEIHQLPKNKLAETHANTLVKGMGNRRFKKSDH